MSVAMQFWCPSTSALSTCTSNEKVGGEALGVHTIFKSVQCYLYQPLLFTWMLRNEYHTS